MPIKANIFAVAAIMVATGAIAQSDQSGSHNPITKNSKARNVDAPAKGHSSFTEGQAKGRLDKAGFTNVSNLRKTDDGAWQGTAMKDGRNVTVTLDYMGNVTSR